MPSVFIFLVLLTVGLNTAAQTLLKLGSKSPLSPYLLAGVAVYGLSTLVYITLLGRSNLTVAYPVVIGLSVVVTVFSGVLLLGEQVSAMQWAGIVLTLFGIVLIASSKLT